MIKLNKVTWYSQAAAIVLALIIFFAGVYVGLQIEKGRGGEVEVLSTE